jgi:hypothetical protein
MLLFSMGDLRRDSADAQWVQPLNKKPCFREEKQGLEKLRAMADPLVNKVSCPAQSRSACHPKAEGAA